MDNASIFRKSTNRLIDSVSWLISLVEFKTGMKPNHPIKNHHIAWQRVRGQPTVLTPVLATIALPKLEAEFSGENQLLQPLAQSSTVGFSDEMSALAFLKHQENVKNIGWDFCLMPDSADNNPVKGKVYLSQNGDYVVRDNNGQVQQGVLDKTNINIRNLSLKLNDWDFKRKVLSMISEQKKVELSSGKIAIYDKKAFMDGGQGVNFIQNLVGTGKYWADPDKPGLVAGLIDANKMNNIQLQLFGSGASTGNVEALKKLREAKIRV